MKKIVIGTILGIALGSPVYLPWVLARFGNYKRWYLARFIPPFSWSRSVYFWPASLFFLSIPFIAFLPIDGETRLLMWAGTGFVGFFLAIIMAIWTPRWAKPKWQRYLEDHYSHEKIQTFIPVWREMDPQKWSELLDSEKGIEELVTIARSAHQVQQ